MNFKDLHAILQNLRRDENITFTKIGHALKITKGAVSSAVKSGRQVRVDELEKLENEFNVKLLNLPEFLPEGTRTAGDRLQVVRKSLNLTTSELAKDLNISTRTLGAYERNELTINSVIYSKLVKLYNVNIDYLLSNKAPMFFEQDYRDCISDDFIEDINNAKPQLDLPTENDIIEIDRIYDVRPECGAGTELYSEPYIEPFRISRQSIKAYLRCSSPENLKTFQASGDSMEDKISDGDWLLVDIGRRDASVSGVYIFTANGLYRCKRLNLTLDGKLEVKSDNKNYQTEIVGPDSGVEINIVGRVLNNLSKGL